MKIGGTDGQNGGSGKRPASLRDLLMAAAAAGAVIGIVAKDVASRFKEGVCGIHPETYRRIMSHEMFTQAERDLARQTFHESQSETEGHVIKALAGRDPGAAGMRAQLAAAYPRLAAVAEIVADQEDEDSAYARWCRKVDGLNRLTVASLPPEPPADPAAEPARPGSGPDPRDN